MSGIEKKIEGLTTNEVNELRKVLLQMAAQTKRRIYDNEDLKTSILVKNKKGKTWYVTPMHLEKFRGRDGLEVVREEKVTKKSSK